MKISKPNYEYLLGVYLGDGTPYNRNGISIAVGKDRFDYAKYLAKLLSPYKSRIYKDFYGGKKSKSFCYRVISNDKTFFPQNFIIYKKKGKWNLPILQHPEYLLAGIFDTDGSVRAKTTPKLSRMNNYFEIVIYQKEKRNLELLLPLFDKLNLFPNLIRHTKEPEMWLLRFAHITQIKIFSRLIPSKHPRKFKILNQVEGI